jgi:ADP-ribosylglycohydrolase
MNLILNKLRITNIQLLRKLKPLDIGIPYEFQLIGRYYIFCRVTCNAALQVSGSTAVAATVSQNCRLTRT